MPTWSEAEMAEFPSSLRDLDPDILDEPFVPLGTGIFLFPLFKCRPLSDGLEGVGWQRAPAGSSSKEREGC